VVDLGAGTGKLTRSLCARGLVVTAVEPSEDMREQLALAVPEAARGLRPGGTLGMGWNLELPDRTECYRAARRRA
jgi:SAM-dependent methyltransferase